MAENIKENPSNTEWEMVSAESGTPINFEIGTVFVGTFSGIKHIIPPNANKPEDEFDQAMFSDPEGLTRTINPGYKLREALADIEIGKLVRITRMDDVPSNDPSKNAMKDFRVEVAK